MMRHPINTLADAVGFLAERCDLLAVQLEIVPPLWKVVSLDGEFEVLLTDAELMEFARDERDVRAAMAARALWNPTPAAPATECEAEARPIKTTADAISFLGALDVEVIETAGGLIVRPI